PGGATTKETPMSNKTLLLTIGALALAACDSPTAPKTVRLEAMVLRPPSPIVRLAEWIVFTSARAGAPGYNEIYRMTPDGSGVVQLTNTPGNDAAPAWSPDGSKIAFSSTRDGNHEIYVMNATDGSGLVRLTNDALWDDHPAWSPDGSKIAFSKYSAIYVMNATDG